MDPFQILKNAKTILLVDWPDIGLPMAVLNAGFEVLSYSPDQYSKAEVKDGKVVFNQIEGRPGQVDVVNIFRPEAEYDEIIKKHVLPLGAKTVWLHPPVTLKFKNELAEKYGIEFVEGVNIADVAAEIK